MIPHKNLPSDSRLPLLPNAVLTIEYPTYAKPANIAEHRATLLTVLSLEPVTLAITPSSEYGCLSLLKTKFTFS